MDWKLELVVVPVTDVDRAKRFYSEQVGFTVDHDTRIADELHVVQLTPPGSGCSIAVGTGLAATPAGSVEGLQLVVDDIEAARSQLAERGVEVSRVQHYEGADRVDGPGGRWNSFIFFSDPDGNGWTVQERPAEAMAPPTADEPVRQSVTVPVPAEQAFTAFADLARWWPREYTWAADTLENIGIDPHREGGLCYERGPHGFTCHWGRVLAWDPPTRLAFTWQIAPDRVPEPNPSKASEVEVRFHPTDTSGTRVELEHRAFPRHGDAAPTYRHALASPEGWPLILARYAATLS